MSNKHNIYIPIILIAMVGFLLWKPTIAFSKTAQRWDIKIESYNLSSSHIAGDTFRVEVRFTNRSPFWMHSVVAKLFYPDGAEPIMEHFYNRVVSRFPWRGHFIDFDNRFIKFVFPDSIAHSEEKFFAFFTATKYGKLDFKYEIQWIDNDSLVYRQTEEGQTVFFSESTRTDSSEMESNISNEDDIDNNYNDSNINSENNEKVTITFWVKKKLYLLISIFIWLLFLIFYLKLRSRENKHYIELKDSLDVLVEAQKKLISLEIERSNIEKNEDEQSET